MKKPKNGPAAGQEEEDGWKKADPNSNRNDGAHFWVPIPNPSAVFASRSLDRGCHRAMTCTPHRSGQNTEYLSPLLKWGRRTADMLIAHLNFSSGSADDAATLQSLWASLSLPLSLSPPESESRRRSPCPPAASLVKSNASPSMPQPHRGHVPSSVAL